MTKAERLEKVLNFSDYKPKTWMAVIDGLHDHYGFQRHFMNGSRSASKSGQSGFFTYDLGIGIYEQCEEGNRKFILVYEGKQGIAWCSATEARVKAMLAMAADGKEFEATRLATRLAMKPA